MASLAALGLDGHNLALCSAFRRFHHQTADRSRSIILLQMSSRVCLILVSSAFPLCFPSKVLSLPYLSVCYV